jgi:hypothetical protein
MKLGSRAKFFRDRGDHLAIRDRLHWLWLDLRDPESRIGLLYDPVLVERLTLWIQGKTWALYWTPWKFIYVRKDGDGFPVDRDDPETWSF